MSRLRTLMSQSPAIIISLIALTFSLGTGAGYAATAVGSSPATTKITWHTLSLKNGWTGTAKYFSGTGNPAYTVTGGVVYLTGVAHRSNTAVPSVIGVLPKGDRPKHSLWFAGFNYAGSGQSEIAVFPNGNVEVLGGTTAGDQYYFTSLAGIEFPLGS